MDINDAKQVVGVVYSYTYDDGADAVLWESGQMAELASLGGDQPSAAAISSDGTVAGRSQYLGQWDTTAVLWTNGTIEHQGVPGLGGFNAINDYGEATGHRGSTTSARPSAPRVTSTSPTPLCRMAQTGSIGLIRWRQPCPFDKRLTEVVGYSENEDDRLRAFLWKSDQFYDLNDLISADSGGRSGMPAISTIVVRSRATARLTMDPYRFRPAPDSRAGDARPRWGGDVCFCRTPTTEHHPLNARSPSLRRAAGSPRQFASSLPPIDGSTEHRMNG